MELFKKSIPYLLIALLTGWFSYKFFVERKAPKEPTMALDWDELDSTGSAPTPEPASLKHTPTREFTKVSEEDADKFEAFDEMEKNWLASVQVIMGPEHFPKYLQMRTDNEKEKMQAYKEYHDFLRQKHGDKFSYNISEDQSVREKQINQEYLKKLLALIGEKKFQAYISARDLINEENRKSGKQFIQVEF